MYLYVLGFFNRYVILTGQSNLSINFRARLIKTKYIDININQSITYTCSRFYFLVYLFFFFYCGGSGKMTYGP